MLYLVTLKLRVNDQHEISVFLIFLLILWQMYSHTEHKYQVIALA